MIFEWFNKFKIPDPGSYLFITSLPISSNGATDRVHYAVAMDGSGHIAFPANWDLQMLNPNGENAVIVDTKNTVSVNGKTLAPLKWVDLKTGALKNVPFLENPAFSHDGAAVIGVKPGGLGTSTAVAYSWSTGLQENLCLQAVGSDIFIKEISAQTYFISAYDDSKKILNFFIRKKSGVCQKKNSIPVVNPQVREIASSTDLSKILVKVSSILENRVHDQLYYVPMNGEASLAVNSAVYRGAKVNAFQFLNDSRTVLYFGDQITPANQNAFLWRAP
jgi:hypothetical protein